MSRPAQHVRPLHVVVTCSNRKRDPIATGLRLGSIRETRPGQRFKIWTQRLAAMPQPTRAAIDMYAGEHWQVARSLPAGSKVPVTLWVCSAGYGLIPASLPIHPYAATFAAGEPDSVGAERAAVGDWWQRHTTWSPSGNQPRSITQLVKANPEAITLAVLSEAYQRACARDLQTAAEAAATDQLAVIGPPGAIPELADLIVPITAALQPRLGGSLQALNIRAAAALLAMSNQASSSPTHSRLIEAASDLTPTTTARRTAGTKLDDAAVIAFIRSELRAEPASATVLLRRLRASGRSCEQGRFGALYAQVSGKADRRGR
jgi:hypothetical protein